MTVPGIAAALVALVIAGAIYEVFAVAAEQERFPAPGQLVAIDGDHAVHLRTWGAGRDGPTVILDAGAGSFSSQWAWIGPALGASVRAVAYDRPGLGWSDVISDQRDARASAAALHAALRKAEVEPPYLLVGHSLGGFSMRMFRDLYPSDTVGLVLIDAVHPDALGGREPGNMLYAVLAALSRTGLLQLVNPLAGLTQSLPAEDAERTATVAVWPSVLDAAASEMAAWGTSARQVRESGGLGDLPLLVVTADNNTMVDGWEERQRELAALSTNSRHVTIPGSDHQSLAVNETHATLVATEILRMITAIETAP